MFLGILAKRLLCVGLAYWLAIGLLYAQMDSTRSLQTVTIRGFSPERFMSGLKIQRVDSVLVEAYKFQTLAEFLVTQAPLQLKSYGVGQLTTTGFRGTSANHTAVLWNGININSPMVGLSDFSTIPLAGFDQLSIQYGSAASCVGTDAVGGSILLNSNANFKKKGVFTSIGQRLGSFDNYQTQVGIRFATVLNKNWQLSSKTVLYSGKLNNRFPYTERRGYLVEPSETMQQGFIQDLYFRNKKQNQVSINIWLSDNKLTLAPDNPVGREVTQSKSYRLLTNYEHGKTTIKGGLIRDVVDYGKGPDFETKPSHSVTDRLILRAEHEIDFVKPNITARIGGELVHYRSQVDGYVAGHITENRADVYALFRYKINNKLLTSLNLRQAFVTRYDPPLTPSFGIEYRLINKDYQLVTLKSNVAGSYRVPTLNERYWRVLGNPDIKPEHGFSKEIGFEIKQDFSTKIKATASITAFHNRMDDWTYWNPDRGFRVENLQLVIARGVELQATGQYQYDGFSTGLFAQYALTRSTQERIYDPTAQDIVGKQLIYLPLHTGSINGFVKFDKLFRFTVLWQGSSLRYYTFDNSKFIKGYQLVSLMLEKEVQMSKVHGKVVLSVDNIFDTLYLNVKRNAMPGRSAAVNLNFNF